MDEAPLCALCRERPATSREHVVLDALGGRRTVLGFICEPCNNGRGGDIDAALELAHRPMSILAGCVRGDGTPVAAMRGLVTTEGDRVDLHPGGQPVGRGGAAVDVEQQEDGRVRIQLNTLTEEQAVNLLYHQCRRFGVTVDQLVDTKVVNREHTIAPVQINTSYGGAEQYRSIAKMGLAAIVRRWGRAALDQPAMAGVLGFVDRGEHPPPRQLDAAAAHVVRATAGSQPGEHVLLAWEDVDGIQCCFCAFGFQAFRILLAPAPVGLRGVACHVVNPRERTHRVVDGVAPPEVRAVSALPVPTEDELRHVQDQLLNYVTEVNSADYANAVQAEAAAAADPASVYARHVLLARGEVLDTELNLDAILEQVRERLENDG